MWADLSDGMMMRGGFLNAYPGTQKQTQVGAAYARSASTRHLLSRCRSFASLVVRVALSLRGPPRPAVLTSSRTAATPHTVKTRRSDDRNCSRCFPSAKQKLFEDSDETVCGNERLTRPHFSADPSMRFFVSACRDESSAPILSSALQ